MTAKGLTSSQGPCNLATQWHFDIDVADVLPLSEDLEAPSLVIEIRVAQKLITEPFSMLRQERCGLNASLSIKL